MSFKKPFENPYEGQSFSSFSSVSDMMTTGSDVKQNNSTLGNRGSESAFFLPSVKSWNEQIKKSQDPFFVKDHTATSYPHQQNVQNYSHSSSNELQSSSKVALASKLHRNDNASASFKKAVDMASRTRDMLNKLDGWKAISLKLPSDFKAQEVSPKTCMIKSSSQYTTLDAKSEDAKNILQNIREMAHLLCPSGGISHFSKTSIQDVDLTKLDDKGSNGTYFNGPKSTECLTGSSAHQQYNRGLSGLGSRINLIGSEGMPVNRNASNVLKPAVQRNGTSENLLSNLENSQDMELFGREPNYGEDYDRFKSLLDAAVVRTKLSHPSPPRNNWQKEESFKSDGHMVSWNKHSENLYEDFDDENATRLFKMAERSGSAEALVMYPGTFPELQNANLFQNTLSKSNEPPSFINNFNKKDQKNWEKETQNFLKKLQGKKSQNVDQDQDNKTWKSLTPKSESRGRDKYLTRPDKFLVHDRGSSRSPVKNNSSSRYKMKYPILSKKRNSKERSRPHLSSDRRKSSLEHGSRNRNRIIREDERRSPHARQRDVLPKFEKSDKKDSKKIELKDEIVAPLKISSDKFGSGKTPLVSGVTYYDDHKHSCKECNVSGLSVSSFIDHLLTPGHIEKNSKSVPQEWQMAKFDRTSLEKKSEDKKSYPICGTHLIHPVTAGFYCQPCVQYFPHKNALLIHLTTRTHEVGTSSFNKRKAQKRPSSAQALVPSPKRAKSDKQNQSTMHTKVDLIKSQKNFVTPSQKNSVTPSQKNSVTPSQKNSVTPSQKNSVAPSQKNSVTPSQKNSVAPAQKNSVAPVQKNEPIFKTKASHSQKTENQPPFDPTDDGDDTDEYPSRALVIDETAGDATSNDIPAHEISCGGAENDSRVEYKLESSTSLMNTSSEDKSNVIKNNSHKSRTGDQSSKTDSKTSFIKSVKKLDTGGKTTSSNANTTEVNDVKDKNNSNISDLKEVWSDNLISVVRGGDSPTSPTCDVNEDSGNEDNLIELDGWDEDGC